MLYAIIHRTSENEQQQKKIKNKKYANLLEKVCVFIFISEIGSMLDNAFFRYFISILYIQFFSTAREQASNLVSERERDSWGAQGGKGKREGYGDDDAREKESKM